MPRFAVLCALDVVFGSVREREVRGRNLTVRGKRWRIDFGMGELQILARKAG
ncbi:MAG: hypothetical protein P8P17_06850 [Pseudomonadales bacterium]|nr:hypothetical protein [Pseudomonadales bacterium]